MQNLGIVILVLLAPMVEIFFFIGQESSKEAPVNIYMQQHSENEKEEGCCLFDFLDLYFYSGKIVSFPLCLDDFIYSKIQIIFLMYLKFIFLNI